MPNILDQIVAHKRREVAAAQAAAPLTDVKHRAADTPPPRDFAAAVSAPSPLVRVIAEAKRASPSAGLIRRDFDPVAIATAYRDAGAAAISCLTDAKYFQGSLTYLQQIRAAVDLPVLRKDFIIAPYQIYEARAAGADAVLLIAECLDGAALGDLADLATELGLGALIELYDEVNLPRVKPLIADARRTHRLVGVNNRNLRTMTTNLAHSLNLARHIDDPSIFVSESGIRTHDDIRRLQAAGVNAVLVGEHLMRQPDIAAALRQLIHGQA